MRDTIREAYEDAEINGHLAAIQHQYPSLTIEEMRQIFDDTYERLTKKRDE